MPLYEFTCECGNTASKVRPMAQHARPVRCKCGKRMARKFSVPGLKVQPAVQYYRPYRAEKAIALTGSVAERKDQIRAADMATLGEEAGARRVPQNLE